MSVTNADLLLEEAGLLSIRDTIIAGTCGVVFQAFVAGNVFPKLIRYFRKHRSDPGLARAGVVWLGGLSAIHLVVANYINIRLITMSSQFTSGFMKDFWLAQLSNLISLLILIPVFLFFAFRSWNLWSRRKLILFSCLANIIPVIGFGLYAAIKGLQHPYPLKTLTNSDFEAWLPFFQGKMADIEWIAMASATSQFSAAASFSGLICVGLWFHRDCCQIMPGLANKIQFAFGESLFPIVIATGALTAGEILTKWFSSPAGPLITRAFHAAAPTIYLHCLMTSLTSPQRHRDPVRNDFEDGPNGFPEKDGKFHNKGSDDGETELPTDPAERWSNVAIPQIFTKRPSIPTLKNPFKAAAANANANGDAEKGKAREELTVTSPRAPRRSSLANLADMTSNTIGGLSIKMQNKLPVVSFRPGAMSRRESESIFEAHEEFEGLPGHGLNGTSGPNTPAGNGQDERKGLGIIHEDAPETPKSEGPSEGDFHTPRATTPVGLMPNPPANEWAGAVSPGGETIHVQSNV